jgi:hypothetical protein
MAREFAQIRLDLWADPDVRKLTESAQRLYLLLLTSPKLTYAGVADWRPGKIAALAADSTADSIRAAAAELEAAWFVVVDEDTEEIMIRSFLRHDGLLKQPRVAVSMATAYAATASAKLRGVMIHELHRLAKEHPEWPAWGRPQVEVIMRHEAIDPKGLGGVLTEHLGVPLGVTLGVDFPQIEPNVSGLPTPAPSPSPTPAPSSKEDIGARKNRATQIPTNFEVTADMAKWARETFPAVNVAFETNAFRDFHVAKGSTFKDWVAAWRTWIRNADKFSGGGGRASVPPKPSLWDMPAVKPETAPSTPTGWGAGS